MDKMEDGIKKKGWLNAFYTSPLMLWEGPVTFNRRYHRMRFVVLWPDSKLFILTPDLQKDVQTNLVFWSNYSF